MRHPDDPWPPENWGGRENWYELPARRYGPRGPLGVWAGALSEHADRAGWPGRSVTEAPPVSLGHRVPRRPGADDQGGGLPVYFRRYWAGR